MVLSKTETRGSCTSDAIFFKNISFGWRAVKIAHIASLLLERRRSGKTKIAGKKRHDKFSEMNFFVIKNGVVTLYVQEWIQMQFNYLLVTRLFCVVSIVIHMSK